MATTSPTWDFGESDLKTMMGSNAAIKAFVQSKVDKVYENGASAVELHYKYSDDGENGVKQFSVHDLVTALFALVTLAEAMDENFPDEHKDILLSFRNLPWDANLVPRQCSFKCKV